MKATTYCSIIIAACSSHWVSGLARAVPPSTTQSTQISSELSKSTLALSPRIVDPRAKAVAAIGGSNMYIVPFDLVDKKPAAVIKEPIYIGIPQYGAFRIGNGPKSVTYFAIDEAKGFAGKIYVDQNQNGDLTDDGSADWDESHVPSYGRYSNKVVTVHASWGSALEEKESGSYDLFVTKSDGAPRGAYAKITARTGMLKLGGKSYPVVLSENTGDGIFTVPADGDLTRPPVNLFVDTENSTPFDVWAAEGAAKSRRVPQKFDLGHPFQIESHWYMARPSVSGATLTAQETTAPDQRKPLPAVTQDKLPLGISAPDIILRTPDGKPVRLSDYKGKLVILDFWATWCVPCQASMPLLEKLYKGVKDQGVVVLSVCVLDENERFNKWISTHANKDYSFDFAFDPAAKEDNSIAKTSYAIEAIPAWFLITRDGKIAAKDFGFDGTEGKLIRALREKNISVEKD